MPKDASKVVSKFQQRVASAAPDYTAGVQNPKTDWLAAYKASQARMAAGLQAAIASGKMAKQAEAKGGTANWQNKAANKGARNYAASAADAAAGYSAKVDKVLAAGEAARNAAKNMPNTTQDQRLQRALAAMKAVSDAWKK
jgi:uncharacterized membrane protein YkoI